MNIEQFLKPNKLTLIFISVSLLATLILFWGKSANFILNNIFWIFPVFILVLYLTERILSSKKASSIFIVFTPLFFTIIMPIFFQGICLIYGIFSLSCPYYDPFKSYHPFNSGVIDIQYFSFIAIFVSGMYYLTVQFLNRISIIKEQKNISFRLKPFSCSIVKKSLVLASMVSVVVICFFTFFSIASEISDSKGDLSSFYPGEEVGFVIAIMQPVYIATFIIAFILAYISFKLIGFIKSKNPPSRF